MKKLWTLAIALFFTSVYGIGQDILGGEMSYQHLNANTYSVEVNLYTRTSLALDHSEKMIELGDGSPSLEIQGNATILEGDVTEWTYSFNHFFPGPGIYFLQSADSGRMAETVNISNAEQEDIVLFSQLTLNPMAGVNNSAQFVNKQTEVEWSDDILWHDAAAIDIDGDELVYSLVEATSSNYSFPPGATIDPSTGLFQMPFAEGLYAVRIKVEEWREDVLVGVSYREMTIDSNTITNLEEIGESSNLTAFPNPFHHQLVVESTLPLNEIQVFDSSGRVVYQDSQMSSNRQVLDLGGLTSGIYFVHAIAPQGISKVLTVVKE